MTNTQTLPTYEFCFTHDLDKMSIQSMNILPSNL